MILSILYFIIKSFLLFLFVQIIYNFAIRIGPILYARKVDYSKYGAFKGGWILITGPTDGIGYEFASQYADRGFNILAVGRNKEKLEDVRNLIESKGRLYKSVVIDFATATEADLKRVVDIAKTVDLRMVMFNAGMSHQYPKFFVDEDKKVVDSILNVNVVSVVNLTRELIPLVKKPGMIIYVGSVTGKFPAIYLAPYTATKAFIRSFSRGLSAEYRNSGLHVEILELYYVATKMSKIKPAFVAPTPKQFVDFTIPRIGTNFEWVPYPSHALMGVLRVLPDRAVEHIAYTVNTKIMRRIAAKKHLMENKDNSTDIETKK